MPGTSSRGMPNEATSHECSLFGADLLFGQYENKLSMLLFQARDDVHQNFVNLLLILAAFYIIGMQVN